MMHQILYMLYYIHVYTLENDNRELPAALLLYHIPYVVHLRTSITRPSLIPTRRLLAGIIAFIGFRQRFHGILPVNNGAAPG